MYHEIASGQARNIFTVSNWPEIILRVYYGVHVHTCPGPTLSYTCEDLLVVLDYVMILFRKDNGPRHARIRLRWRTIMG